MPEDLNEILVLNILTLKSNKPVDLLIRTSGVTRLSDFLLRTTNDETWLESMDITWPEIKLHHFIKAFFVVTNNYCYRNLVVSIRVLFLLLKSILL